jgi:GMP synthase (glutamine-hydrolysing)
MKSVPVLRVLVVEAEPAEARDEQRESVGKSSGETYVDALQILEPAICCDRVKAGDRQAKLPSSEEAAAYDAGFMIG